MFRGGSRRSRREAPLVTPLADEPQESPNWRPSLRRIKKSLFSKSRVPENSDIGKPEGMNSATGPALVEIHQQHLNDRDNRRNTANPAESQSGQSSARKPSVVRKCRPVSMGSRPPNGTPTIRFVNQSLSRASSRRMSRQEPREPIFVMRDISQDEIEIISARAPASSTAAYIPRHAAADFQKVSSNQSQQSEDSFIPQRPLPRPTSGQSQAQASPKSASQHKRTASDISMHQLPFNLDPNGLAQHPPDRNISTVTNTARHRSLVSDAGFAQHHLNPNTSTGTNTARHRSRISVADLDDYQRFLEASQLTPAGTYNSYGVISSSDFTPRASQMMQDVIANRQAVERERAHALSQLSTASPGATRHSVEMERAHALAQLSAASLKGGKSSGIIERVADYVRPVSVGSQRTRWMSFGGGDEKASSKDSVFGDGEAEGEKDKRRSRWNRMSGSIRRSFSKNKEREGDGIQMKEIQVEGTQMEGIPMEGAQMEGNRIEGAEGMGRKRKTRIMPLSPGLQRFNATVANGGY